MKDAFHAYLILAHSDPEHLKRLVHALDDARNDIYIHIDKKADLSTFNFIGTEKAQLFFLEQRVDVRWGGESIIDAELELFKAAYSKSKYSRYHLISGADFPLKTQNEIHEFFEKHKGEEFLDLRENDKTSKELYKKCHLYNFFLPYIKDPNRIIAKSANIARKILMLIQILVGVNRKYTIGELKYGSQWCSVTHVFVKKNTVL